MASSIIPDGMPTFRKYLSGCTFFERGPGLAETTEMRNDKTKRRKQIRCIGTMAVRTLQFPLFF